MLSSLHTIFPPHLGFSPLRSDGANYAMLRGKFDFSVHDLRF